MGREGATKAGKPLSEKVAALNEENSSSQMSSASVRIDQSSSYYIKGDSAKTGWTSEDSSILKGTNLSIKNDRQLFAITAKENKEVTFNFNVVLESGDNEVVLILPDRTETVLYDTHSETDQKTVILKEGENSILLRWDAVVLKSIDLSMDGLKLSDF